MSCQLSYSLSRALFFDNSHSKVSGLLFMFVRASTLSKQDMHFLGAKRPAMVYFSCEMAENTTRNARLKFVKSHSTQFSTQKRNLPLKKTYLCVTVINRLYLAFISLIWAAIAIPVCSLLSV